MTPSEAGGPTEKPVGTVASRVVAGAIGTSIGSGLSAPAAKTGAVPGRTTGETKLSAASVAGTHH